MSLSQDIRQIARRLRVKDKFLKEWSESLVYKDGSLDVSLTECYFGDSSKNILVLFVDSKGKETVLCEGSSHFWNGNLQEYYSIFHEGPWIEHIQAVAKIRREERDLKLKQDAQKEKERWELDHSPTDI